MFIQNSQKILFGQIPKHDWGKTQRQNVFFSAVNFFLFFWVTRYDDLNKWS